MNATGSQSRDVADGYDRGAASYAEAWKQPHPWMAESREQFGKRVRSGMSLLDVGCGPGHDSAYWTGKGLTTLGIDISSKMIDLARGLYAALEFQVIDVIELSELHRTFDAVWMAYSLLHITKNSALDLVRAIRCVLEPEGLLFVETSITNQTEEAIRPIAGLKEATGQDINVPYTTWSIADLTAVLQTSFTVEWSKTYCPLPGRPDTWSAILRAK